MSSPAQAFVDRRNFLRSIPVEKRAGWMEDLGQTMSDHPWATGATIGGGLGALKGLMSEDGSVIKNTLGGAGLGLLGGMGYDAYRNWQGAPDQPNIEQAGPPEPPELRHQAPAWLQNQPGSSEALQALAQTPAPTEPWQPGYRAQLPDNGNDSSWINDVLERGRPEPSPEQYRSL